MASIQEIRDKSGEVIKYKIVVTLGYDNTGVRRRKTYYWHPDPQKSKRQNDRELQKYAIQLDEAVSKEDPFAKEPIFRDYADYVVRHKEGQGKKKRTVDRYRSLMPRVNEEIGNMKMTQITARHLNLLYQHLQKEGIRNQPERARPIMDIRAWLKENNKSIAGFSREIGIPENTVKRALNNRPVLKATADAIAKGMCYLPEQVFEYFRNSTPLSTNTVLAYHRFLSAVFSFAVKEGVIQENPAAKASPPQYRKSEPEYYQPETVREILRKLKNEPLKWRLFIFLLMDTGCRRGEIAGLKWDAVDMENGIIDIKETLLYSPPRGTYADTPKNHKSRVLGISPQTTTLLKAWKAEQDRQKTNAAELWTDTGYVFTNEYGVQLHPDSGTKWLDEFARRNDLPHLHPHAFRHTAASIMISEGIDIVTTASELGHASPAITANVYSHVINEQKRKAAKKRSTIFDQIDAEQDDEGGVEGGAEFAGGCQK